MSMIKNLTSPFLLVSELSIFLELFLFKLRAFASDIILQAVNIDIILKIEFKLLMANKIFFWIRGIIQF